MKIILDECVPSIVKRELPDSDIVTVQDRNGRGLPTVGGRKIEI